MGQNKSTFMFLKYSATALPYIIPISILRACNNIHIKECKRFIVYTFTKKQKNRYYFYNGLTFEEDFAEKCRICKVTTLLRPGEIEFYDRSFVPIVGLC